MPRFQAFLLFITLLASVPTQLLAAEVTIEGVYRGKNLFIRNPFFQETGNFCITSISVNNNTLGNLPKSSAIQIDLSHLAIDSRVVIIIQHADDCTPVIVNPEAIKEGGSFAFLYTQVEENAVNWITTGEQPGGKFHIEKLKLKGWQELFTVDSKGEIDNNQYSVSASHYTGDNIYRIIYTTKENESFQSDQVSFYSLQDPISISPGDKVIDWISLSRPTDYEIYNENDELLMSGIGDEINVTSLGYGEYYLIVEDEPMRFFIPKPEIIPRKRRKARGKKDNNLN